MRQSNGSKQLPAGALHGRGIDPRMLMPCSIALSGGAHDKRRIGYAACTDEELKPGGKYETPRAKFIRELEEKRRAH